MRVWAIEKENESKGKGGGGIIVSAGKGATSEQLDLAWRTSE